MALTTAVKWFRCDMLEIKNIDKIYKINVNNLGKTEDLHAVKNVSFTVNENDAFGLIGESGSGKSTIGNMICKSVPITSGDILYKGQSVKGLKGQALKDYRKDVQVISQSGKEVLDPKMTIREHLSAPLSIFNLYEPAQYDEVIKRLLKDVGLTNDILDKFPGQLSGGMLQRITIARVLATEPKLIICDEPVSALDVSIQGLIINLLVTLKKKYKFTYIFISHNLKVVQHICNRIGVLKSGELLETGSTDEVITQPKAEYSKLLVSAMFNANISNNK